MKDFYLDNFAIILSVAILLTIITFFSQCGLASVIYDGKQRGYSVGTPLDSHGSSIYEESTALRNGKKFIRIILKKYQEKKPRDLQSQSSAVGYGFDDWAGIDVSRKKILKLTMKANAEIPILMTILDNNKTGDTVEVTLYKQKTNYGIPLVDFGKINLKMATTLIFSKKIPKNGPDELIIDLELIEFI